MGHQPQVSLPTMCLVVRYLVILVTQVQAHLDQPRNLTMHYLQVHVGLVMALSTQVLSLNHIMHLRTVMRLAVITLIRLVSRAAKSCSYI